MNTKVIKASSRFNRFFKKTLGTFLINKYHVSCENNCLKNLEAPYIILSNHVNNLDPFLISQFVDDPIHFIAADEQYRNPIKKFFLQNLLGSIPKMKFISDMETIKHILKLVKQDCIIGIFPEGRRNWDGVTGEILPSTSKLIKLLKIPIVICILEGAYLSHPRWAVNNKIGEIQIHFKTVIEAEAICDMSVNEIQNELNKLLYHNEYEAQKYKQLLYKGNRIAEKLERFLFICPNCHSIAAVKSFYNQFYCTHCKYTVVYNELGYFESPTDQVFFDTPYRWNKWQLQYLFELMKKLYYKKEKITIYNDEHVSLFSGKRFSQLKKIAVGRLTLNNKGFYFIETNQKMFTFHIKLISGLNVQYSNELEFYYQKRLFRFKFADQGTSAYKWTEALHYHEKFLPPSSGENIHTTLAAE